MKHDVHAPRLIAPDFKISVDDEIALTLPTLEEASEIFKLVDRNRGRLREFLGWVDGSKQVADTKKFIEENYEMWLRLDALHLSIKHGNKTIGAVGFHHVDWENQAAFIGYWLDEAFEGKGIMTKCVEILIDHCFKKFNFHRLQILCATNNPKSKAIPTRLGFRYEGTMRDAIFLHGKFYDGELFALLKQDWDS